VPQLSSKRYSYRIYSHPSTSTKIPRNQLTLLKSYRERYFKNCMVSRMFHTHFVCTDSYSNDGLDDYRYQVELSFTKTGSSSVEIAAVGTAETAARSRLGTLSRVSLGSDEKNQTHLIFYWWPVACRISGLFAEHLTCLWNSV